MKKKTTCRSKKREWLISNDNNYNCQQIDNKIQKIVIFICSIIISSGFKGVKIWLTRMISSLCRKP